MSSAEIEAEIASLEKQFNELRDELDRRLALFQRELPTLAVPWIEQHVQRAIRQNHKRATALESDQLRSLKDKVNSLIASLPEIAKQETSNRAAWPHRRTPIERSCRNYFEETFRRVISHLGPILDEYGLIKSSPMADWEKTSGGEFRYLTYTGFDLRQDPTPNFREYSHAYKDYIDTAAKLLNKKTEVAKTKP
jgi:hypothetical protein